MRKYFFLFSALFLLLVGTAIYQDSNPEWKKHQKEFRRLAINKAKAQWDEARARFEAPEMKSRRQALEVALQKAEREFKDDPIRSEYQKNIAEKKNAEKDLELNRDRFQKARIELQKLELARLGERVTAKRDEVRGLEEAVRASSQKLTQIQGALDALEAAAKNAKKDLEEFLAPLAQAERKLKEARAQKIGLRQILNEDLGIADRCMSCHLGAGDKDFLNEPTPHSYHAMLLEEHPVEQYGCAACHRGQARATNKKEAHEGLEDWPFPILPRDYIEASCASCHSGPKVPETLRLNNGRKLFLEAGCLGCHPHQGYGKAAKIGPDLTAVGSKVQPSWLKKWLKNPKDYLPNTRMPNFLLSDKEIESISSFLLTLKDDSVHEKKRIAGTYELGEKLFKESRCVSCHSLNGRGGKTGPDLGKIAAKSNRPYVLEYIKNPRKFQPETKMPRFRFSQSQLESLVEYMFAEFQDYDAAPESKGKPGSTPSGEQIAEGKRLIRHYGCYGCHNIPGIAGVEVGAELTDLGLKRERQLDWGLVPARQKERSLIHWLTVKLKDPRAFRDTLKMPQYGFSDEEVQSLVTLLLSFTETKIPEKYAAKKERRISGFLPAGEFGKILRDLNCLVCHSANGHGGSIAPDISFVGSQIQNDWLANFLQNPVTIRLHLAERMPKFRFSYEEAGAIANYLRMYFINDEIAEKSQSFPAWKGDQIRGRKLFFDYGCTACHQLGGEGGSVGPELAQVGRRLTPGWIFSWLKNPQKYRPETMEPNLGLSDQETSDLTAFLVDQK